MPTYKPTLYFFYGTLTQSEMLRHVLDISKDQRVTLRPTEIIGCSFTNLGQYRALIDGEPGEEVHGRAYLVTSIEDEQKLARYETSTYEARPCDIYFTDNDVEKRQGEKGGNAVDGMAFKYAGDDKALKVGRFGRFLWEMQMGIRLPESGEPETQSSFGDQSKRNFEPAS